MREAQPGKLVAAILSEVKLAGGTYQLCPRISSLLYPVIFMNLQSGTVSGIWVGKGWELEGMQAAQSMPQN